MTELTKPVISKEKKLAQIADFLLHFNQYEKPSSLMGGDIGVAIFLAEYARFSKNQSYAQKALELVNNAFDVVENHHIINSYCNGLAGMCWGINHLFSQNLLEGDSNEILDEASVDKVIAMRMLYQLRKKEYDYMHAGTGPMLYFLERLTVKNSKAILENAVQILDSIAVKENGHTKWRHDPEYKLKEIQPRRCLYNLGLSHGIPSIIAILSKTYEAGIEKERCASLIEGAVEWVLSTKLGEGYASMYETGIYEDGVKGSSRLGWCYGDLGVALPLWHAAKAMNRSDWREESLLAFRHAAGRQNQVGNGVRDAGLCHGSAGISHIFYKMYLQTQEQAFIDASDYWLDRTLQFDTFEDGYCGYKSARLEDFESTYNLIEGVAGIGATILSRLSQASSSWDKMFLIS